MSAVHKKLCKTRIKFGLLNCPHYIIKYYKNILAAVFDLLWRKLFHLFVLALHIRIVQLFLFLCLLRRCEFLLWTIAFAEGVSYINRSGGCLVHVGHHESALVVSKQCCPNKCAWFSLPFRILVVLIHLLAKYVLQLLLVDLVNLLEEPVQAERTCYVLLF